MTTRAAWKRRLSHLSASDLEKSRRVYQELIDTYMQHPGLGDASMHENAVTALREIDAALRHFLISTDGS